MTGYATRSVAGLVSVTFLRELPNVLRDLRYEGQEVQVTAANELGTAGPTRVEIGDIKPGRVEVPTMKEGRKHRNQAFRINIKVIADRPTLEEALDHAGLIFGEIESWIADQNDLGLGIASLRIPDIDFESNITKSGEFSGGWKVTYTLKPFIEVRLV